MKVVLNIFQAITLILFSNLILCRDLVYDPYPISQVALSALNNLNVYMSAISSDQKYAYITALQGGVFVVSLGDMIHLNVVANIPAEGAQYVQESNGILYIADVVQGFLIYNVTDVEKPILISNWKDQPHIQSVVVTSNKQTAILVGNGIVYVLDISNPTAPLLLDTTGIYSPVTYRVKLSSDETHIVVSNHIKGVQIYDIRIKSKLILRASKNPAYATWDCIFTPDNSSIYVVDAYYGLSYANVSPIFGMSIGSTTQFQLTFTLLYLTSDVSQSIAITTDGQFIIFGLRSVGLKLFQIVDNKYDSPIFVQNLEGDYLSNNIVFSKNNNEAYVFVTNGITFLIYQQVVLNSNKDFPNFFNTYQSSSYYLSSDQWPWQIECLSDNKHIIQTNPSVNTKIFDIEDTYYPELKSNITRNGGDFSGIATTNDLQYLLIAASQLGLQIYDISNFSSPLYKTNYTPLDPVLVGNQGVGVTIDKSGKVAILANGFYGFGIIDISDPINFKEIGKYINTSFPCGFEKCEITSDLSTIICACRETGLLFYDFSNQNLQLVSVIQKLGSEFLILSSDEKYAFVSNGFQGLLIVNIQNKYSPFIVSQQLMDGWASSLTTLFDEQYIIASQIEKGQLVIINIEDLTNPYIQSKVQFPNETSNSLCITPDDKVAFFIGKAGLRQLPIQTNLIIHTQIHVQKTDSQNNIYYQNLLQGDALLVGQTALIFFIPLYTTNGILISNAYYYRNFQKQTLPSWMQLYSNQMQITVTVDKLGAYNNFSNEKKGENIIVLECLIQLNSDSFVTNNINATIASQIYQTLSQQGYVDSQGYLTSQLDPSKKFDLDFFDDAQFTKQNVGNETQIANIQKDIKKILVFSLIEYPIRFYIQSSLSFNYNRVLYADRDILQTPSLQLIVFIQILSNGKIVKKTYAGVIATISEDLTSLKIQGQTNYVNAIISNQIEIANKTSNLTDCVIDFIISDTSNYDISQQLTLSDLSFISLYKPIFMNQSNTLQHQFNKMYSGGVLDVETKYSFQFDVNTFKQSDSLSLSYSAYIVSGNQFTQITTGGWIEFNEFNIGFNAQKSFSQLFSTYRIKVVATDGYSDLSDEFEIRFSGVPFFYIIQLLVQILGPIIGFLGIWNYRSYFYFDDSAIVGQLYKKQIVLMNEIPTDAYSLWNSFINKNKNINSELIQEYSQRKFIDFHKLISRVKDVYCSEKKRYPHIDQREFSFTESRLVRIIRRQCYEILLKQDKNTQFVLNHLVEVGSKTHNKKDWYKGFVEISCTFEIEANQIIKICDPESQQDLQQNNSQQHDTLNSDIQLKLFSSDNFQMHLNKNSKKEESHFFKGNDDVENNNPHKNNQNTLILKDESSLQRFNNGSQFNDKQMELESEQNNQANASSVNNKLKIQIDQIIIDNDRNNYQNEKMRRETKAELSNLNPFPDFIVKMDDIIKEMGIHRPQIQFDQLILEEIIILEASGIRKKLPSRMNPAQGESIYLHSHQLLRVQAFKKEENGCCMKLKQCLNADYNPIGFIQNNPLPKWLNYQIVDGIIHMWGIPQQNDEPEVLIRVIDHLTFTILSFHIYLKDSNGNNLKDSDNTPQIKYRQNKKNQSIIKRREVEEKRESITNILPFNSKYDKKISEEEKIIQLQQLKYSKESSILISFVKQNTNHNQKDHSIEDIPNLDEKNVISIELFFILTNLLISL